MRFLACILVLVVASAAGADTPLKQSTAVTVKLGPFVDSTDGVTAETALTISQADVRLSKAGGDYAQKSESSAATHDELGEYDVDLDTTDTATLGPLRLMVQESGALPVWRDFVVMPANVYDSLYSTDKLQVDAVEMSGSSTAADNAETAFTGTITTFDALDTAQDTQHASTQSSIGTVGTDVTTVAGFTSNLNTWWTDGGRLDLIVDGILADTAEIGVAGAGLSAVPYNAAWDAEIQSEAADALTAYDPPTNAELEARTLAAASYFDPAADEVDLGSILGTAITESAGGQVAGGFSYWYDVATPAKTINDAGVAGAGLSAEDVWTYGTRSLSGTIQTLDALDTAQDTQHTATQTAISGLNDLSAAAVNAEVDTAIADAALATAASLATAQADLDILTGTDGVTLATLQPNYSPATAAALAALNDLSAAEVNAQVDAALVDIHLDHLLAADYDPASKPGVSTALWNELIGNNSGVSRLNVNVTEMNEAAVLGTGTSVDKWRGE